MLRTLKPFGAAIKAARKKHGKSRNKCSDATYISARYLANVENKGQQPSLQMFYDLVTRYDLSVAQFFFPDKPVDKSSNRRLLDTLADGLSEEGIEILIATAQKIAEIEVEKAKEQETRKGFLLAGCRKAHWTER